MQLTGGTRIGWWLFVLCAVQAGCTHVDPFGPATQAASTTPTNLPDAALGSVSPACQSPVVQTVALRQAADTTPQLSGVTFEGMDNLSVEALIGQVLARNPSLAQMMAAWQAASARYPQVTSLDDPMFRTNLAPAAIGKLGDGNQGYTLELSQKYPWPGKLRLRGENALAEASAAGNGVDDVRLQLVESAKDAFYEYYLVYRAIEVNDESLRLLSEFRGNAADRYKT